MFLHVRIHRHRSPRLRIRILLRRQVIISLHSISPLLSTYLCLQTSNIAQGDDSNAKPQPSEAAVPAGPKSPIGRGPRPVRKSGAHAKHLEAVDDSLGPLGPLGDASFGASQTLPAELPPAPPFKESSAGPAGRDRSLTPQPSASKGTLDSTDLEDDVDASTRIKVAPPVHMPAATSTQQPRHTRPSVPVEQAANPKFEITVGDPHKVGDLTSSHIVYQVRTRVRRHNYGLEWKRIRS